MVNDADERRQNRMIKQIIRNPQTSATVMDGWMDVAERERRFKGGAFSPALA